MLILFVGKKVQRFESSFGIASVLRGAEDFAHELAGRYHGEDYQFSGLGRIADHSASVWVSKEECLVFCLV